MASWLSLPLLLALPQEAAPPAAPAPAIAPAAAPAPPRRSVVFCLIDTCRADRMSMNGHERPTTPFLEQLATRGVRLSRCFSQAPWTKPSMSSILTSCYPSVTGMYQLLDQLDNRFVTLPEAFRDAGWYTAGFSANPLMGRLSNYAQGFRRFKEAVEVIPNGDPNHFSSGSAARLNAHVLPWLAGEPQQPFFLYVHSVDPHEEYEPAPEFLAQFADPAFEPEYRRQWQALIDAEPGRVANHCTAPVFEKAGVAIEPFIRYGLDLYDADVRANDDALEELIGTLERQHGLENLILVITADHGEEFMEHGGTSHAFALWNELLHVPLLIVAPGLLPEGVVIDAPVPSIDLYPTLCELAGVALPDGLQGKSFAPLLRGEPADGRPIFAENHEMPGSERFFANQGNTLALIEGPWKLILNLKSPWNRPRPRRELYRLDRDFGETTDLAAQESERADALEATLLEWWARNRARQQGVAIGSLTVDELQAVDPETLARLKALGYVK
ncbi:MAG: sulfatase [Planctomycetes bacterium]|nr:sulfatase [Planctomycetota bacterium]